MRPPLSLPLHLFSIPVIPRIRRRHCHPPVSLLNKSSNFPPFPHALHCHFFSSYLPCIHYHRFGHYHISTANILIKPSISSSTGIAPPHLCHCHFPLTFIFPCILPPPHLIILCHCTAPPTSPSPSLHISTGHSNYAFDFNVSLTHHNFNSDVILSIL